MSDDIHIDDLWERWLPLEQLASRVGVCRCCQKEALPFQSRCASCKEAWLAQEDQRIRRRRKATAGFTEECVRCGRRTPATWVTRHEAWSVHKTSPKTFRIGMEGICWCTYCLECMEYLLGHPALVERRFPYPILVPGDCVYWERNIYPIRKIKDADVDPLYAQVTAILRSKQF